MSFAHSEFVGIFPQILQGSSDLFKKGLWLAQVPENSPFFLKINLIAIPENAIAINNAEIRNNSIGQSYKKIVILIVLNLIKNYNIKFYSKWLLLVISLVSCDSNFLKVSESEIKYASTWSINDQPPSFPECENLKIDEQLICFRNKIEMEMNNFLNKKVFPLDTTDYILTIKIDIKGNFSLDNLLPENKLDKKSVIIIKQAVEQLPKALPAIKTNVGEFVEVKFNLPIKLNYE